MTAGENSVGQDRAAAVPPVPRVFVSTDHVPERQRLAFFCEEFARLARVEMIPLNDAAPHHSLTVISAGAVDWMIAEGSPTRYVRAPRHVADCDEDFVFGFARTGWSHIEHNGRATDHGPGDGYLMLNSRTFECTIPEGTVETALRVEARALRALVRHPEDLAGARFDRRSPGIALLAGYLQAFEAASNALTPGLLHTFGLHIVDLLAAVIGATRDGAAQAEEGGVRAARLREVLSAIATRAGDPAFGIEALGTQLAVTPRYIQRLLEETGTTFSGHVLEHRLHKAWRLLADPACTLKVAAIAYDCGFNDLSNFNRVFRRRFGETPTAVRGAARPPEPAGGAMRDPTLAERLARQGGLQ